MIDTTYQDGVAVLAMRHGKVNALDIALCQALCAALDHAAVGGAQAVVLTGTGTVFSAGVDLHRVIAGRDEYLASFLPELRKVFTRLATFELPLVAAVNGHAIAGGYILAAAADWVLMAEGPGRAGVTEMLVGVPFPAIALELLRMRVGDAPARPLIVDGATFAAGPGAGPPPDRRGRGRRGPGRPLAGRRPATRGPGAGVPPHQTPATAPAASPRSGPGRPRRRRRRRLAGTAHAGPDRVLHGLTQASCGLSADHGSRDADRGRPQSVSPSAVTPCFRAGKADCYMQV